MTTLILSTVLGLASLQPETAKPVSGRRAIKKADAVVANVNIRAFPAEERVDKYGNVTRPSAQIGPRPIYRKDVEIAIEMVGNSKALSNSIKQSVTIGGVTNEQGVLTIRGTFPGRKKKVRQYLIDEERESLRDFDKDTGDLRFKWEQVVLVHHQTREHYHTQYHGGSNWELTHHYRHHLAAEREHIRNMAQRGADRTRLLRGFMKRAELRKKTAETVSVTAAISPALAATIDLARLSSSKRVTLTFEVVSFGIRGPMPEVREPAAIDSLTVKVIAIERKMLLKKGA